MLHIIDNEYVYYFIDIEVYKFSKIQEPLQIFGHQKVDMKDVPY